VVNTCSVVCHATCWMLRVDVDLDVMEVQSIRVLCTEYNHAFIDIDVDMDIQRHTDTGGEAHNSIGLSNTEEILGLKI